MNGIDCFFEGFRLVRQPGLRKYVIIPLLINTLVLSALLFYGWNQYDAWETSLMSLMPDWMQFLSWLIGILAGLIVFFIGIYVFSIIANIIASPFNALLAERVESELIGDQNRTAINPMVVIGRTVAREISKLVYFLPRLLGLLILSLIPGINVIAPIAWLWFGAWMMAVQYTDFAADNNHLSFTDLRARLSESRFNAVMFGIIVYFVTAVPLLQLVLIPIAVAGGTVYWVKNLR